MGLKFLIALAIMGQCSAVGLAGHKNEKDLSGVSRASKIDPGFPGDGCQASTVKKIKKALEELDDNPDPGGNKNLKSPTIISKQENTISVLNTRTKSVSPDINPAIILDPSKEDKRKTEQKFAIEVDGRAYQKLLWEDEKQGYKALAIFSIFFYSMLVSLYYFCYLGSFIFK
ncbi:hypothetical protein PGT21_027621 [Puccinia graminis f. sp. tritici]|uniref:Uncharacterized protein n=1 Tax=Puccinia graminis f. sp. tritici TaxID=56615 RepID=A0A5B0P2F8_PUCGR|nr:hypothetical protein PGT21_027621 [Puccinia graminis f. sp. tritici]KAA1128938.1 hypothetical protein PGTUg99_007343 [Puccinia graminis f. sp. tritici]